MLGYLNICRLVDWNNDELVDSCITYQAPVQKVMVLWPMR